MAKGPKAVQQQADEADRLLAELANPQPDGEQQNDGNQPPAEGSTEGTPAEGAAPEGATAEGGETAGQTPDETWEQRYSTLQGKYDAEIPRLAQANSDLRAELQYLKGKLEAAEKFIQAPPAKEPEPPKVDPKLEEFKKDYPDIYDYVQTLIATNKPASEGLDTKLQQLTEATQKSAAERFYDSLDRFAPEWQTLNSDPKFQEWLQGVDPYTGLSKYQLLAGAYQNQNAKVVSNFFNDYKATLEPASTGTTPPNNTGQTGTNKAKYVAPGTTKGSSAPAGGTQDTKTYTKSEIDEFYKKAALGKLRLTPEQKAAQEVLYWNAMREGRVDSSR